MEQRNEITNKLYHTYKFNEEKYPFNMSTRQLQIYYTHSIYIITSHDIWVEQGIVEKVATIGL
jgi:hypothetical protein